MFEEMLVITLLIAIFFVVFYIIYNNKCGCNKNLIENFNNYDYYNRKINKLIVRMN
jgi:predicted PurR-regulated permease PerM